MAREKLSTEFKATPNKETWNQLCPENEYRVISHADALKEGIIPNGMNNINSVIIAASGSCDDRIMYFANYCRHDNGSIDQDIYMELFESGSSQPSLSGILHHGDFPGRTEILNPDELNRIAASGSTADIRFAAKPNKNQGTLEELHLQGKITGFNHTLAQGIDKKGQK